MFSMKDTKVSIKSAAERLKQNAIVNKLSGFQSSSFERGHEKKMKNACKNKKLTLIVIISILEDNNMLLVSDKYSI